MKKIITVLLIAYSTIAWSDATINGVVKDQNNNPLPGVSVFVVKSFNNWVFLTYTTTTNSNGEYSLSLPYGQRQHEVATNQAISGFFSPFFDFEGETIQIEFGSVDSVPYRWNDAGGRVIDCAFGCSIESAQSNENIVLGAGNFSLTLNEIMVDTSVQGVSYSGQVIDDQAQAIENPVVSIESSFNSSFKTNYFPATSQVNGGYQSMMVPSDAKVLISADKDGFVKTYHDGTQCNPNVFCQPAISSQALVNDIVLAQGAVIQINRPQFPIGADFFYRNVRLYDNQGRSMSSGYCGLNGGPNDIPTDPCYFSDLIPDHSYHLIFEGNETTNGERAPNVRQFHNGDTLGCGSHWQPEKSFPANGIIVNGEQPIVIDFPDLQNGFKVSGKLIDKNTQLPIVLNPNDYLGLYVEIFDAQGLDSAGILSLNDNQNNEVTFESCGSAGIKNGSYYLATAHQLLYESMMKGDSDLGDYKPFVHNGIDCLGKQCDFTGATSIEINNSNLTDLVIELEKGSRIEGCFFYEDQSNVINFENGGYLNNKLGVQVFSEFDELLETASAQYNDLGNQTYQLCYSSSALPAGNYKVRTNNGSAQFNDHGNVIVSSIRGVDFSNGFFDAAAGLTAENCSGGLCEMNDMVTLDGSTHVTRNFYISEGPVITGRLKDNVSGSLLSEKHIKAELYTSNDEYVGSYQFITNQAQFMTTGLVDGDYEIRLSGVSGYFDSSLTTNTRNGNQSQLSTSIPVTINGSSVDIGTITAITDMIFKDGLESQ